MTGNSESRAFSRTREVFAQGHAKRLHHGLQIFVSRRGQCLLDEAWGTRGDAAAAVTVAPQSVESSDEVSFRALSPSDLMLWMSAGKPLLAAALARLVLAGRLDWDEPVTQSLPEFQDVGRPLTVQHLLTHQSGLALTEIEWNGSLPDIVAQLSADPARRPPGQTAAYSPAANWFVLGEIIARVHRQPFLASMRDLILAPCSMQHTFNGMSASEYSVHSEKIVPVYSRVRGELVPDPVLSGKSATTVSPGGNWRGPVRELGWFYECLFGYRVANGEAGQGTQRIAAEEWVSIRNALVVPGRIGEQDATFRHIIDFGRGVILNSNRYGPTTVPYGYGRGASDSAVGHGGSQCSIAFADPRYELVVAWAANGRPGEGQHQRRNRALNDAIYEDLGFSSSGS